MYYFRLVISFTEYAYFLFYLCFKMKAVLIILAIIIAIPLCVYIVSLISRKKSVNSLKDETNFLQLLHAELNGWSGICKGDSYRFVLSRLQHLGLISKEEVSNTLSNYDMFGARVGITVKPEKYVNLDSVSFRFNNNELLSSIGFLFKDSKDVVNTTYPKYMAEISDLFGKPTWQGSFPDGVGSSWKNMMLSTTTGSPSDKEAVHLWLVLNFK